MDQHTFQCIYLIRVSVPKAQNVVRYQKYLRNTSKASIQIVILPAKRIKPNLPLLLSLLSLFY